jgi:GNAT superfamily N-acetyltransferase
LAEFQKQGVGRLLLDALKARWARHKLMAETDKDSRGFYVKCGFSCHVFLGPHKNMRHTCDY